jgi:hypothetical protein
MIAPIALAKGTPTPNRKGSKKVSKKAGQPSTRSVIINNQNGHEKAISP